MLMDKQKQTNLSCRNVHKGEFENTRRGDLMFSAIKHNPSQKKQQPIIASKPHIKTGHKVIIEIKTNDIIETILPRPSLSKKSASFSHQAYVSRISTNSQGTVRVPVPFVSKVVTVFE